MRRLAPFAAISALSACATAAPVNGVFNNERDYYAALAEHDAAWQAAAPDGMSRSRLADLVDGFDGTCVLTRDRRTPQDLRRPIGSEAAASGISCYVEVEPRPIGIDGRVLWSVDLAYRDDDAFVVVQRNLTQLGLDL